VLTHDQLGLQVAGGQPACTIKGVDRYLLSSKIRQFEFDGRGRASYI
jgi:hypothetical protein